MDLQPFKEFLVEIAAGSGELIRRHWNDDHLATERKADDSPVTIADKEAEEYIRERITKSFPGHGIIGEEYPNADPDAELVWVIDPIDGTKSFISHVPLFGTLVGLLHRGEPILGMIHQPILNELLIGDNKTTTFNGQPTRIRSCQSLSEATLLTTEPGYFTEDAERPGANALRKRCRLTRCWGDCYGYLLLATGRADIMFDPVMEPWDLLPLIPVMRGAGAVISDWKGGDSARGKCAVAACPELHPEVIRTLNA